MKVTLLCTCIVESDGYAPVMLIAGDTIDVADKHAESAIKRGLAVPSKSSDDLETNAPEREKSAMRKSPEYH